MRRLPTILSATLLASCLPIPATFANTQDDCENARGETAIEMACGKLIESAAANREDLFNAHATAGVAYRDSGLGDQAISEYSKAIAIEPNSAIVRVLRGQAFNKAHVRLREAVGDFTKAIQIDPKLVLAYVGRSAALHALNENDKALADLARAIQLDPTSVAGYLMRASLYQDLGELDEAIADFTKSISLDPSLDAAFVGRGVLRLARNDLDGALADASRVIQLTPSDPRPICCALEF
jgi:tetratricopeptide (TPR) repeat protein